MLTRSDVAKRLGRSLATVRRMEGRSLHPRLGANGTRLFDADEVERVANDVAETGRALPPEDVLASYNSGEPALYEVELEKLRAELSLAEERLRESEEVRVQLKDRLDELHSECRRWASEIDEGCALLIQATNGHIRELAVDALVELIDNAPGGQANNLLALLV